MTASWRQHQRQADQWMTKPCFSGKFNALIRTEALWQYLRSTNPDPLVMHVSITDPAWRYISISSANSSLLCPPPLSQNVACYSEFNFWEALQLLT